MSIKNKYDDRVVDDSSKDVFLLLQSANQYYKVEEYKKAIKVYQQVIRLTPNASDAYVGKGNCLLKQEKYGQAQSAYEKALAIDPQNASAYNGLGYLYISSKKYDKALTMLGSAIKLDPKNATAHNGKGQVLRFQRNNGEALQSFEEAIKRARDTDNIAEYYYNKGRVLYEIQQYEDALNAVDQALQHIQNNEQKADAYVAKGNILLELKQYHDAIQSFDTALRFQPDPSISYLGKGKAFFQLGHYEEAIQAFKKALRYNNKLPDAYVYKGHALSKIKLVEEAIEAYEQAITLNTKDISCYLCAGELLTTQRAHDKALQVYKQAQQLDPEQTLAYQAQAQLLFELQRYEEALTTYQQIIIRDEKHIIANLRIGDILSILHMPEMALEAYEKMLQLVSNESDAYAIWLLANTLHDSYRPSHIQFALLQYFIICASWDQQTVQSLRSIAQFYEQLFTAERLSASQFNANIQALQNLLVHIPEMRQAEVLLLIADGNDTRLAELLIMLAPRSQAGLTDLAHQLTQRWIPQKNNNLGIRLYHVLDGYGVPIEDSDWLLAQELIVREQYIQVKSILSDLVKQHPTPERLWFLAIAMQHRKDPLQEQIEAFCTFTKSAATSDPRRGQAWQSIGDMIATQGNGMAAIDAYKNAEEAYKQAKCYDYRIPQLQDFRAGNWDTLPALDREPDYVFPPVVVLDLENDYSPDAPLGSRVFEIGAVRVKGSTELDTCSLVIQRNFISSKVAQRQNEAVAPKQAIQILQKFIGNSIIVGHNIQAFDAPHLREMGLSISDDQIIDTLTFARLLYPDSIHHHLELLRSFHPISSQGEAHTALPDAKVCASLLHTFGNALLDRGERLLSGFRAFVSPGSAFDRAILQPRNIIVDPATTWDLDPAPTRPHVVISLMDSPASPSMLEAMTTGKDALVERYDPSAAYIHHLPIQQKAVITLGTHSRLECALATSQDRADLYVLPNPQTLLCPQLLRQHIEQVPNMQLKLTLFCLYQASHNHDASTLYPLRIPIEPEQQINEEMHDENQSEPTRVRLRQILLESCCASNQHPADSCPTHIAAKQAALDSRLLLATHQNFLRQQKRPVGGLIIVDDADQLQMHFAEDIAERLTSEQVQLHSATAFQLLNDLVSNYAREYLNRPGFHERIHLRNIVPYLMQSTDEEGKNLLETLRLCGTEGKKIADTLENFCLQSLKEEQHAETVHAYWLDLWFSREPQINEAIVERWSFCGLHQDLRQAFHEIFWQPYQQRIISGTAISLGAHGTKFFRRFFDLPAQLAFMADERESTQVYIPSSNVIRPASFLAQRSWAKSIGTFLYKLALSYKQSLVITLQSAPVANALAQTLASQMPAVPQVLSPYLNWTTAKIVERLASSNKPVIAILPPRLRQSSVNEAVDIEATGPLRFLNQRDPLVTAQMATFAKSNKNEGAFTSYLLPQALLELKARTASPAKIHIILDSALQDKAYRDEVCSLFRENEMIDSLSEITNVPQSKVDSFAEVFSNELEQRGFSRLTNVSDQDLSLTLTTLWETTSFRKPPLSSLDQEHVVRTVLEGKDQLVVAATGGGKSLCYQLPAVLMAQDVLPKITLIFSPLIALMEDQVKGLHSKGIFSAIAINSTLNSYQQQLYIKGIERGDYSIIYIAPEKIRSTALRRALQKREIGLIAFDEAHCVSQWGHNFRTEYFAVKKWIDTWICGEQKRNFPVLALTATARKGYKSPSGDYKERNTVQDIIEKLGLNLTENDVQVTAPERKELAFRIEIPAFACPHCQYQFATQYANPVCPSCGRRCKFSKEIILEAKCERLVSLLAEKGEVGLRQQWEKPYGQRQRGIVFCRTTRETERVTQYLRQHIPELRVDFFYGGNNTPQMSKEKRQVVPQRFITDEKDGLDVVVATNAFGMGIDVRRLGFVIHFDIPASPEAYYQEAGRAGRDKEFLEDNNRAQCILLYHEQDLNDQNWLISQNAIIEIDIVNVYQALCKLRSGRGQELLVTEQDIRLLANIEKSGKKNGPNITTILYYLENHTLLNGQPILERSENGEELKQLKFEIEYKKRIGDPVLSASSQKLISFFCTSTKFGLNDKELTIIDINELATDLQWKTRELQKEIMNLIRRQILVQESHCYIQWAKSKHEIREIIKEVEEDIRQLFKSVNDPIALQTGKEVLVNFTDLYKKGELSAIPLDTFTSFLSELSKNTGSQQLLAGFKRSQQDSESHSYHLRLRPPSEVQSVHIRLRKELYPIIERFYHFQEATSDRKNTGWEFIDILKEAPNSEERLHLRWQLHLLQRLGLLEIKEDTLAESREDDTTKRNIAMRLSFKQQCEANDRISIDLFIVRQVEHAAQQKLELMQRYATTSQGQPQNLFRSYFYGEEPLIEPFKIDPKLTEEQRAFVTFTEGYHLITGPAGSGKSEVLKEHIKYLIRDRLVPPHHVLVVAHYQSASDRMGNDVEDVEKDRHIKTMTLNTLGTSIFKRYRHLLKREDGQPYYTEGQELILLPSKEDEKPLIQDILSFADGQEELPLPKSWPGRLAYPLLPKKPSDLDTKCLVAISLLRQQGIFPSNSVTAPEIRDALNHSKLNKDDALFYYAIYLHHFIQMSEKGWYTYDDQILFALTILQRYPHILKQDQYLQKYEHIIIDEFQDLTLAQTKLIQRLSTGRNNVFAVGDDEQDIRPKEIHSTLAEAFTTLSGRNDPPHQLTINFRSVQEILNLAYAVRNIRPTRNFRNKTYQPLQTANRGSRGEMPAMIRVSTDPSMQGNDNTRDNHLLKTMIDKTLHLMSQLPPCDTGSVALMVARANLLEGVRNYLQELKQPFSEMINTRKYQSLPVRYILVYFRLILDKQQDSEMKLLLRSCLGYQLAGQIAEMGKTTQENRQSLAEIIQDNDVLMQIGVPEQQLVILRQHLNILQYQPDSSSRKVWEEIRELKYGSSTNGIDQDQKIEMEDIEAALKDILPLTVQKAIDHVNSHISFVDKNRPSNGLILTTIDHAKSQDFDTVFLLGAHWLRDKKRWYVGISRARQRFFFLIDGNEETSKHPILTHITDDYDEITPSEQYCEHN